MLTQRWAQVKMVVVWVSLVGLAVGGYATGYLIDGEVAGAVGITLGFGLGVLNSMLAFR
jgi:hypothetical protein